MAHAHLRRCRQQSVPHTNRKYQKTPAAQNRCTDAEFWTQLAVLVAEATSPVVQIRRRSPQVQHAKPPDATNARTGRTTTESKANGTKGATRTNRDTQSRTTSASSTGTAKQAQKRKDEHTHHLPRATTENPTKPKHTRAKTEQHHRKRRGRENNKHKQKRRRTKKKERKSTHTPPGKRTNKQASKHKQTQTNNTILSRMNPPPSEPHQPTTQKSWKMRGAGVLTRVFAPSLVPLSQRASNSIQIDPPRRNSE